MFLVSLSDSTALNSFSITFIYFAKPITCFFNCPKPRILTFSTWHDHLTSLWFSFCQDPECPGTWWMLPFQLLFPPLLLRKLGLHSPHVCMKKWGIAQPTTLVSNHRSNDNDSLFSLALVPKGTNLLCGVSSSVKPNVKFGSGYCHTKSSDRLETTIIPCLKTAVRLG